MGEDHRSHPEAEAQLCSRFAKVFVFMTDKKGPSYLRLNDCHNPACHAYKGNDKQHQTH